MIDGWRETTLRDIATCKGGTSFPPVLQGRSKGEVPFYKVSDMNTLGNERLMDAANNYVDLSELKKLKTQPHAALSVVFPKVGGALLTNKKRMLSRPALVDNNMMVVTPKDRKACNPHFLLMFFESLNLRNLSNPGPLPSINAARVYEHALCLPPLPEQKKIAAVLLKIQRAIETQDKIIQSLRDLKKSTMQHLFTHGLRGEKTKMTDIGEIPESWDVVALGEMGRVGNGSTPKKTNHAYWADGTIPWLTSGKIHEGIITVSDQFVTPKAKKECHLPTVRKGGLLIAITGQGKTLGNAALVDFNSTMSQHLAYVQPDNADMHAPFIWHYLSTQYRALRQIGFGGGSTKGALTCAALREYPVPRPKTIAEQEEVADMLADIDSKRAIHESKKSALQDLFKTTLNELMTGDIRVADLDIDVKEVEV